MLRNAFIASFALTGSLLFAQDMALSGGTLTVASGTTVTLNGPIVWTIMPGASVVDDGRIELGGEASMVEQAGAPITGSGTERAVWTVPGPLSNAEPGNLGLTLTTAYSQGDLEIVRGHQPATAGNGTPGIARWYQVVMPGGALDASVRMWYDQTELNGIDPATLSIFEAPLFPGPWTALASVNNTGAQTVEATDQAPVGFITAYDLEAASAIGLAPDLPAVQVWPSRFHDHLQLASAAPISQVELIGPDGRVIWQQVLAGMSGTLTLTPQVLAQGPYILRVDGRWTFKLIRE